MDGELFRHTQQHSNNLNTRYGELLNHLKNPLSETRKEQIRREMACIYFELYMRDTDNVNRQKEIDTLEQTFNHE